MRVSGVVLVEMLPELVVESKPKREAGTGPSTVFSPALLAVLERDPGLRLRLLEAMESARGIGH